VYNQAAPSIGGRSPEIRNEYDNNLDGTFETVVVTPSVGLTGSPVVLNRTVDPNLHASFVDEVHVGYTRQLPYKLVFDTGYVDRKYRDPIGTLNTNIIFEHGAFVGYHDPTIGFDAATPTAIINPSILETTNLKNSFQRYQDLEFSLIRNVGGRFQAFL